MEKVEKVRKIFYSHEWFCKRVIIPPSRPFRFFFDPLDELLFLSLLFQRINMLFMGILFAYSYFTNRNGMRHIKFAYRSMFFFFVCFCLTLSIDACKIYLSIAFFLRYALRAEALLFIYVLTVFLCFLILLLLRSLVIYSTDIRI